MQWMEMPKISRKASISAKKTMSARLLFKNSRRISWDLRMLSSNELDSWDGRIENNIKVLQLANVVHE